MLNVKEIVSQRLKNDLLSWKVSLSYLAKSSKSLIRLSSIAALCFDDKAIYSKLDDPESCSIESLAS